MFADTYVMPTFAQAPSATTLVAVVDTAMVETVATTETDATMAETVTSDHTISFETWKKYKQHQKHFEVRSTPVQHLLAPWRASDIAPVPRFDAGMDEGHRRRRHHKRGDLEVTSLQHDGVILALPPHWAADAESEDARTSLLARTLSEVCSTALGYAQGRRRGQRW